MRQEITPIAVQPGTLNGIFERMIVRHYESHYGGAVRTLNAVGGHGFDARYIRGDVSAWYAAGGPRALRSVAS